MSRPLRLQFHDAVYHVTSRGDRREAIFIDDIDREVLLAIVAKGMARFDAAVFAYCLMGNHYHFVLRTRRPNLSQLMRHINGVYTQSYNRRHEKIGHVFHGRFKAILVDEDAYLLEVCRYVDLNPVRAGIVAGPHDWEWSSYRAHVGAARSPTWLDSSAIRDQIAPDAARREAEERYRAFVAQGFGHRLWDAALSAQVYLGGPEFVHHMQCHLDAASSSEVPLIQRRLPARSLNWYFLEYQRDQAIFMAHAEGGYTLRAIAREAKLSTSRVSRLVRSAEQVMKAP